MDLVILGSGTGVPSLRRGSPGYLLRLGDERILVDGGSGTLPRLLRAGVRINELSRVLYTHFHPDHTGDLIPLLFALRNPGYRRDEPLPLTGPRGLRALVETLQAAYRELVRWGPEDATITEIDEGERPFAGARLAARHVEHTPASLAYRLEFDGKVLVLSGDTGACDAIVELAQRADCLVLECSYPDGLGVAGHLTPSECGEIAARAGARRLVLTHFYPECEVADLVAPCRKQFGGEVAVAEDGMRVVV
jgi:ribonuclease BN (tRNA processing enzyme)